MDINTKIDKLWREAIELTGKGFINLACCKLSEIDALKAKKANDDDAPLEVALQTVERLTLGVV